MTIKDARFSLLMYIANKIVAHVPSRRIRRAFGVRVLDLEIGKNTFIHMGTHFDSRHNFRIGNNSVILQNCRMDNRGSISIGDCVSISEEVIILTADHDPQSASFDSRERPVRIGSYAFLGTRCMVLPGVTIGKGAVVAAGAVVTRDVPDFGIVGGIPAKQIGSRQPDLQYTINHGPWLS